MDRYTHIPPIANVAGHCKGELGSAKSPFPQKNLPGEWMTNAIDRTMLSDTATDTTTTARGSAMGRAREHFRK